MTIEKFLQKFPDASFYDGITEGILTRKICATILHLYLQKVLHEKDEIGIEKAYFIKDLFDCRVCANHIAQICLKGIMQPCKLAEDLFLFHLEEEIDEEESELYLLRANNIENRLKV